MSTIEISHLSKRYGPVIALDDVSLHVPEGSVFGLLGPNGAGKSTAFKCMLALTRPDSGGVHIAGQPLVATSFERIAYVPERSVLYEWMTVEQHLEMSRRAFSSFDVARALALLRDFGVDPRKRVRHLSKGMRTATMVAMAFSRSADVLILDEPTSGLDPINQRQVLALAISEAARGATVVFSSHQIGQVERAADRIAVLDRGRVSLDGAVDDLKSDRKIVEGVLSDANAPLDGLAADPRVARVDRTGRIVRALVVSGAEEVAGTLERAGASGVRVLDLNLEDIFLYAVAPADARADVVVQGSS